MLSPEAVRLDGKVAVVTGGGSGIGRGIAKGLATFGAQVAVWEKNPDTCGAAAEEVAGLAVPTDVRDATQVESARAATVAHYGTVDILVNNAGVAVFLASELSSYMTGQTLHVDGGTSASMGWYHDPDDGEYVYGPPRSRR